MTEKTWVEISRRALMHNVQMLSRVVAPAGLIVPIKGNAYGHGMMEIAKLLGEARVSWFAVDHWQDAIDLRQAHFPQRILLMGYVPVEQIRKVLSNRIDIDVYTQETLDEVIRCANAKCPAFLHLEIETGFVRQGISLQDLPVFLKKIAAVKSVNLEGVMTHFANVEDAKKQTYAAYQLAKLAQAKTIVARHGFSKVKYHMASSAGAMLLPRSRFDFVRTGIATYGLWPAEVTRHEMEQRDPHFFLMPVLAWKTVVAQVKCIKKGTPVSYGLTERVKRDSIVVVLPIGYFDGFDRVGMSRRAHVLIHGQRCKILGRVCMNMCMADATDVSKISVGDEVIIIGKQGMQEITAEEMADKMKTINYEIVTRINPLIVRKIVS